MPTPNVPAVAAPKAEQALRDIAAERQRQVERLGWSREHDDQHTDAALAVAAAAYALPNMCRPRSTEQYRRDLVKAGALIVAEIERLDRLASGSVALLSRAPEVPQP